MRISKSVKSIIAIYVIATLLLSILTVVIPFPKPPASWVAFAFSIVSLFGGCGIALLAFGKSYTLKSKFYGYPVFRIGFIYSIVQIVITIVLYIVGSFLYVPFWVGLALSLLIMSLAAIGVIAVDNARNYVEGIDHKTSSVSKNIRRFKLDIAYILDMCKDDAVYPQLKKLVDKFKYSDIVSTNETIPVEEQIKCEINELQNMISTENAEVVLTKIEAISNLLSSRNRLCEDSKGYN